MSIEIHAAAPNDLPDLLTLMREFAHYEDLSSSLEVTEDRLHAAMFDDHAFVSGLIVRDGREPIGYALFYPSFASFRAERSIYLEDLYIRESHRGRGIGRKMLKEIAADAYSRGF